MKKILMIIAAVTLTASVWAQSPQKMSYQTVIRNAGNNLVTNKPVGMRISILQGSVSGTEVYKEIYNPNPQTNANGLHGLIAATADQSTGVGWFAGTLTNTIAIANGVGAGKANTAAVIASQGAGDWTTYAARICNEYSVTVGGVTYGDWYLPSIFELNLLYLQKNVVGGFYPTWYWSSNENDGGLAWARVFSTDFQNTFYKAVTSRVRAVRAF
jgi:hypothetical protein